MTIEILSIALIACFLFLSVRLISGALKRQRVVEERIRIFESSPNVRNLLARIKEGSIAYSEKQLKKDIEDFIFIEEFEKNIPTGFLGILYRYIWFPLSIRLFFRVWWARRAADRLNHFLNKIGDE